MTNKAEIVTRFEETRHGPRMLVEKVGEGVAFAADIMVSEGGSELLCLWPSMKPVSEFKDVVGKYLGEAVIWSEGKRVLWGKVDKGEFSLEIQTSQGRVPRATRLLELPNPKGEDIDMVLDVIAQVASETVIEPDLLTPEPLRNSLKSFIEAHFV